MQSSCLNNAKQQDKIKRASSQEEQTFIFRNVRVHEDAHVRIRDFSNCKTRIDIVILERNLESISEELDGALKKEVKIKMIIGNTERSSFQFS